MLSRVLPGHSIFSNLSRVHSAIYFSRRAWIRPFVFTIFPRAFFPRRSSQSPEKARQILDRSKLSGKTEQRNTSENDEHRISRIIPSGIREKKNERLAKSLDRNIVASYVSSTASREQMVLVARVVPFRLNKNTLAATIFAARLDKHGEFLPDE